MIAEHIEVSSGAGAERAIDRFMNRISGKADELAQRLAEEIQSKADTAYAKQANAGNIRTSVLISGSNGSGNRTVSAIGSDVMFLEFGAGVYTDPGHEWASQVGDVEAGSWSKTHARQFVDKGYWFYNGIPYEGLEATRGMLNAFNDVSAKVEKIADEVYQ